MFFTGVVDHGAVICCAVGSVEGSRRRVLSHTHCCCKRHWRKGLAKGGGAAAAQAQRQRRNSSRSSSDRPAVHHQVVPDLRVESWSGW